MDPVDFLAVARQFETSASEAERRTAVGRCYYAVLNQARNRIVDAGADVENAFTHQCVLYYLRLAGTRGYRGASDAHSTLANMKATRERADYELNTPINTNDSQGALRRANSALANLASVSPAQLQGVVLAGPSFTPPRRT